MHVSIDTRLPGLWCRFAGHLVHCTSTFADNSSRKPLIDSVNWHACRLHILMPLHWAVPAVHSSQITIYTDPATSEASYIGESDRLHIKLRGDNW